jgi:hypothetical protein
VGTATATVSTSSSLAPNRLNHLAAHLGVGVLPLQVLPFRHDDVFTTTTTSNDRNAFLLLIKLFSSITIGVKRSNRSEASGQQGKNNEQAI